MPAQRTITWLKAASAIVAGFGALTALGALLGASAPVRPARRHRILAGGWRTGELDAGNPSVLCGRRRHHGGLGIAVVATDDTSICPRTRT